MFSDKITQSIAEAAKKVMEEELKGNQHKIDANKNNKIDAHDFKLLRAKKKVEEEVEQIDEKKYEPAEYNAAAAAARKKREAHEERRREARENGENKPTVRKIAGKAYGGAAQKDDEDMNEEFEQIDERVQGGSDPLQNRQDYAKKHGTGQVYKKTYPGDKKGMTGAYAYDIKRTGPKGTLPEEVEQIDELSKDTLKSYIQKTKDPERKGSLANIISKQGLKGKQSPEFKKRSAWQKKAVDKWWDTGVKEGVTSFSDLIESYTEGGIKSLFKKIEEEVDNETFTKEFKDQKDKFDGKKKGADVAAPASQGVVDVKEETHTEVQVVDMTDGSQKPEITTIDLEDYSLEEIEQYMMSEEFEQLDEISKNTLKSYVNKATIRNLSDRLDTGGQGNTQKTKQRSQNIDRALDKITGKTKPQFKLSSVLPEEVEQIDEKKYEPAEYNAAAAAARKKREAHEERRREARENGENKPTVRKIAGKAYGGAAQKDDEDMNEEFEQIDERVQGGSDPLQNRQDYAKKHGTGQVYKKTYPGDKKGMTGAYAYDIKRTGPKGTLPEEVEQIDELSKDTLKSYIQKTKDPERKGSLANIISKQGLKGKQSPEFKKRSAWQKKAVDKWWDTGVKEGVTSFSDLIESYTEGGIKSLFKKIEEEVDNETFTKEFKDQKDKFDGKKKGADVAAPASQGVVDVKEETHTEVQVVDMTDGSQKPEITTIDLEDYSLEEIEQYMMSEEFEQLDEISKNTLKSYVNKATIRNLSDRLDTGGQGNTQKTKQRSQNIDRALDKITGKTKPQFKLSSVLPEEVKDLEERTLTSAETAEKERIVKSMKKNLPSFKERYGERAKSVMYATATKIAKEEFEQIDETQNEEQSSTIIQEKVPLNPRIKGPRPYQRGDDPKWDEFQDSINKHIAKTSDADYEDYKKRSEKMKKKLRKSLEKGWPNS